MLAEKTRARACYGTHGLKKSKRLSNFADDDYKSMLCLEAANVLEDAVTLEPKQSHTLVTTIKWLG